VECSETRGHLPQPKRLNTHNLLRQAAETQGVAAVVLFITAD
jgi:hypothetical protein